MASRREADALRGVEGVVYIGGIWSNGGKPERLEIIIMQRIVSFFNKKKLTEAEQRLVQLKEAVAEQEATIARLRNQNEESTRENARRTDDSFE